MAQDSVLTPPPEQQEDQCTRGFYQSHAERYYQTYSKLDPYTGNNHKIFGFNIDDPRVVHTAFCPPGLPPEDQDAFFDQSVDILALPGTYVYDKQGYQEETRQDFMTAVVTAMGSMRKMKQGYNDGFW